MVETTVKPTLQAKKQAQEQTPVGHPLVPDVKGGDGASLMNGQFGAYKGGGYDPVITSELWKESERSHALKDNPIGRLARRVISRGGFGALGFAAGSLLITKHMKTSEYMLETAWKELNWMQKIARSIDVGVGKPIKAVVNAVGGDGERAVRFRPTKYFREQGADGRTLGNEVVSITFDFFTASVADAFGRDVVDALDPNVKKTWVDDKGALKPLAWLKSALEAAFRYVTYNGGEDWAVAIPYAYFMKAQRSAINKLSHGFMYDFDRGLNGGSFKINGGHQVTGNYALEGMMDLQSRFTVYNIGTLMYREAYEYLSNKLQGKPTTLYGAPDANEEKHQENSSVLDKLGTGLKWVARSAIKGGIYMTPAVPFFWITRANQSKEKGVLIDPGKGVLAYQGDKQYPEILHAFNINDRPNETLFFEKYERQNSANSINGKQYAWTTFKEEGQTFKNPYGHFNPYYQGVTPLQKGFDKVARSNKSALSYSDTAARFLGKHQDKLNGKGIKTVLKISEYQELTTPALNAAISYTPYMYAKAEFANLWDDGKMDMAAERMIDGAAKLNWGEFKAGAHEVWQSFKRERLDDPAREAEAKRRRMIDQSAPESFTRTQNAREKDYEKVEKNRDPQTYWRDRLVTAPAAPTTYSERFQPKDLEKEIQKSGQTNAEKLAMRKALEESSPPTNSIH